MPTSEKIKIGELAFDCLVAGQKSDPLVILLHGFPESSYMWRQLMSDLADKGFYCVAPDMRGYSEHACPKGKKEYTIKKIAQDIVEIAKVKGEKYHLIAHDWGAAIGWYLAFHQNEKILSYTSLSVPHNSAFGKAWKLDNTQKRKSRYILWFQLPWLPEWYVSRNDFEGFRRLWKHVDEEEVAHNLRIFQRRKSLTAVLNYYRANLKGGRHRIGKIVVPTLFIWGNTDLAIGRMAAEFNHDYMPKDYRFIEVDGGHWLIQSNYKEVSEPIFEHLVAHPEL